MRSAAPSWAEQLLLRREVGRVDRQDLLELVEDQHLGLALVIALGRGLFRYVDQIGGRASPPASRRRPSSALLVQRDQRAEDVPIRPGTT